MKKIIFNLAMSIDGYIADMDGGFEWIKGEGDSSLDTEPIFDFNKFLDSVDTIVMGSKAYLDCPKETLESFSDKKVIVATSRNLISSDDVEFYNGDIVQRILEEREKEGNDIWLFGGAGLVDQFIKKDVIDKYIIGIIPVILGEGRPLFLKDNPTIEMHLKEYGFADGITLLTYTKR